MVWRTSPSVTLALTLCFGLRNEERGEERPAAETCTRDAGKRVSEHEATSDDVAPRHKQAAAALRAGTVPYRTVYNIYAAASSAVNADKFGKCGRPCHARPPDLALKKAAFAIRGFEVLSLYIFSERNRRAAALTRPMVLLASPQKAPASKN